MSFTLKAGAVVVMAVAGTVMSDNDGTKRNGQDGAARMVVEANQPNRPAILQALPANEALQCAIESERRFEPRRRAFVMKKVMVCR